MVQRRDFLKAWGLGAAGLAVSPFLGRVMAAEAGGPRKKILFFTKSAGFEHDGVKRKSADGFGFAEKWLIETGEKNGFDVTVSKDGTLFKDPATIAKYDAFAFYTTGDLTKESDKYKQVPKLGPDGKPMKDAKGKAVMQNGDLLYKEQGMGEDGKANFLNAIREAGKGFIGFHSATDTCHSKGHQKGEMIRDVDEAGHDAFDPYIQMIGGEFIVHGAQQKATLKTIDPKFPGAAAYDNEQFQEEWYSLKNFSPDLHVVLAQDCTGMKGDMYQRALYPETWARLHGKGRVFYTSMGHRQDVWERPEFQGLVVGALKWITGQVEVDVTPNIKQVTPEADPKKVASAK
jgi:type 1 glutamine amidotransferase